MPRLGIDTGGTFTDIVAFDEETAEQWTTKAPSTPTKARSARVADVM